MSIAWTQEIWNQALQNPEANRSHLSRIIPECAVQSGELAEALTLTFALPKYQSWYAEKKAY